MSAAEDLIRLANCDDCPPGTTIEVVAAGRVLAICNVQGEYFGLDGVCPHQGGPLGKGTLCDHVLTCPWHGWQFDVRTGQNTIAATIYQPKIPVCVKDGQLFARRADLTDCDENDSIEE